MKRLFIALPISKKLQTKVHRWQEAHADLPVLWVRGSSLHVTLVPPQWTADEAVLANKLQRVQGAPFQLRFTKIEFGPRPQSPRLIWAYGDEEPPQETVELKERLEQVAEKKSIYKEWLPHITIARFRPEDPAHADMSGASFKNFPVQKLEEQVDWEERFDSFVLMQSHRNEDSAEYEILHRFPLKNQ